MEEGENIFNNLNNVEAESLKVMSLNENLNYKTSYKKFVVQFLCYLILVFCTAGIFVAVERRDKSEDDDGRSIHDVINTIIANFSAQHNVSLSDTRAFISTLDRIISSHDESLEEDYFHEQMTSFHEQMTFQRAFILTVSIFFTIGWGHVYPITTGGKLFAVIVAMIGIPFTFLFLWTGGELLICHLSDFLTKVKKLLRSRSRFYEPEKSSTKVSKRVVIPFVIGVTLIYILMTSYFILKLEELKYGDAIYYSFVTLFTIGFGDFHQTRMFQKHHTGGETVGRILFMFIWLVIGLSLITSVCVMMVLAKEKVPKIGNFYSYNFQRKSTSTEVIVDEEI